jgi:DNA-binding protein H-NS
MAMATYLELQKQIEALQREAEALKSEERQGVIERMKEAVAVYDITAEELGLSRRGGKGSARKNAPKNSATRASASPAPYGDTQGNTWAGRGPRPRWLKEAVANGSKLEDFAQH